MARIALVLMLVGVTFQAGAADGPATCRVGINVAALYDLDPARGSFAADLWLWSLCPDQELSPLSRVELPTAKAGLQLGPLHGEAVAGGYYESRQVRGVFRHQWDMRRYPFDRQRLVVRLEETELGAARLVFAADTKDSFVSAGIDPELSEWRVDDFRVAAGSEQQESSYGFPEAEPSRYTWLEATIDLQRSGVLTFAKLTLPVFAATVFAILCLYFDPRQPSSFQNQVPILVAVLFATIINHRPATTSSAMSAGSPW